MKSKQLIVSSAFAIFLLAMTCLHAQTPELINYQGKLILNGAPVNVSKTLTFAIYDDSTTGTKLWCEQHANVPVTNGVFNVLLGSGTNAGCTNPALSALFGTAGKRYLEMQVQNGPTLGRFRMTSAAFALRAKQAESGGNGSSLDSEDGNRKKVVYVDNDGSVHLAATDNQFEGAQIIWAGSADSSDWITDVHRNNFRIYSSASKIDNQIQLFNFGSNPTTGLYVQGNIGIGTTTPKAKLHVAGGLRAQKGAPVGLDASNVGYAFEEDGDTGMFAVGGNQGAGSDLVLKIDDVEMLRIARATGSGNVGIGTASPTAKLHVRAQDGSIFFESTSNGANFVIGTNEGPKNWVQILNRGGLLALATGGKDRLVITNDDSVGNVGIGGSPVGWGARLVVHGNIHANGNILATGSITPGSSRELKENIADLSLQEAVATLENLAPVKFNYKADEQKDLHVGFIAEDVPELLATPDRKGVNPMDVIAVLTKVVQEQQKQIAALQEEVKALQERNK